MWTKLWETVHGVETGRWQWFTELSVNACGAPKVALPCEISSGETGACYPGVWMSPLAICVPPGVGVCITKEEEVQRNQTLKSMR